MPEFLQENKGKLNQVALEWLRKAKASADPSNLYILELALWGLEKAVPIECPSRDRAAVELQVGHLCGWKPEDTLGWLVENPNGPEDPLEQANDLLNLLRGASSPESAASALLSHIYSRMQAQLPALQPAASELPGT